MSPIFVTAKKELHSFFVSPTAYIIIACFFASTAFLFVGSTFGTNSADMRSLFSNWAVFIFMMCPLITMRLFSEERRSGTIEFLLTVPIRPRHIVLGKYLAAVCLYLFIILLTFIFPLYLEMRADLHWPTLLLQYAGVFLLGAAVLGIGLACSAMTNSTVVAAITGEAIALGLFMISWLRTGTSGVLRIVFEEATLVSHYTSFLQGVLDLKDIIYFFIWILFTLFFAVRLIESPSWRL